MQLEAKYNQAKKRKRLMNTGHGTRELWQTKSYRFATRGSCYIRWPSLYKFSQVPDEGGVFAFEALSAIE